jgi:outer membrane protein assembly factor BamD
MRLRCRWMAAAAALVAVAGCSAKKRLTADEYFRTAAEEMQNGSLQLAVENYRELLDQHPFSEYSEEAELHIAHAYYLDGSCPEAIAAFTDFQRRHPTSPFLPFVGYALGQCYERQMRSPDRDQSASQNAHAYYFALTQQYPDSPFADVARDNIQHCRETLAEHELMVAKYYRRQGNRKAAEYRFIDLVNRFNDTPVAAEALLALGDFYNETGAPERAALAFAAVRTHHPDHELARTAERRLRRLEREQGTPGGDPVVVLQALTGRSRTLALAQVVDVPALDDSRRSPALGPALGAGDYGPFGGRY